MRARSLAEMTWTEIPPRPIVLVPIGSTEQHGPHLPCTTDTLIAEAVARAAAPRMPRAVGQEVVVAPALAYGASGEHQDFPGTISVGHQALGLLLMELIRSLATWADRIILVNGHGGNASTIESIVEQMRREQHTIGVTWCVLPGAVDSHAGHVETSLMLHLAPESVHLAAAESGNTTPLASLLPDLMRSGVRSLSANGVLGDPTKASAHEGHALFEELVELVVAQASAQEST